MPERKTRLKKCCILCPFKGDPEVRVDHKLQCTDKEYEACNHRYGSAENMFNPFTKSDRWEVGRLLPGGDEIIIRTK